MTPEGVSFSHEELEKLLQQSPLPSPPADPTNAVADSPAAARLGQFVFYDRRFSKMSSVACATCHDPKRSFADASSLPSQFVVNRNTPSLWNVAYNRWYFWDGRADSLWAQSLQPMENPAEQAGHRLQFARIVRRDSNLYGEYLRVFGAFPSTPSLNDFFTRNRPSDEDSLLDYGSLWRALDPESKAAIDAFYANVGKSIEAYERKLISRRSPFDVFVEGIRERDTAKISALSTTAQQGAKLFVGKANCRFCHSGPTFTDGEFHNIGVRPAFGAPVPSRFDGITKVLADPFNGQGIHSDDKAAGSRKLGFIVREGDSWGQYKTPTLRNVATTAPYMHQGQFRTLKDVLKYYSTLEGMLEAGHHEKAMLKPLRLSDDEMQCLISFLESLTDVGIDPAYLRAPD